MPDITHGLHLEGRTPTYTTAERERIADAEEAVSRRLATKPKRLAHSLSVAATAEAMALAYGVNPWSARMAGTLHDWDKVLSPKEQLEKARGLGIDMGVDLELVVPLLHGITASRELAELWPDLPSDVLQAIARHTIGAANMTPLDMVVFVADAIEPRRKASPAINDERALVAAGAPLAEVYWSSFSKGVAYVIETERYLYPGTLDIYNDLVRQRHRRVG